MNCANFDNPDVSIVVPFRNAGATLARALESLSIQSYTSWEAILINDASKDEGRKTAADWASRDERFKIIDSQKNIGAAQARNLGIEASRGRWIAFLDADDVWHADKLTKQVKLLKDGSPIVFSHYERVDQQGKSLGVVTTPLEVEYKDALCGNPIGCLTAIWDTKHFGKAKFRNIPIHEDYAFWLSLLRSGARATSVPEVLARYQVASGSLSSNKIRSATAVLSILRAEPDLPLRQVILGFFWYSTRSVWKNGLQFVRAGLNR